MRVLYLICNVNYVNWIYDMAMIHLATNVQNTP